ncbi:sugar transferase [Parasphingorhabdus flavimaris]|jgi:lipopolysaccharide/colanic/teichoic acid biosynthesis glycosyltransferase|uniref:Sugar transferase n=1 Tax=Parasphingorhabdus flavimaris TaxID=266812 RepID=A0ABX2N658_9SPHN|nr:sugar transferase [Parasphingorhabdus flavimaris]NVD29021.1 sugar transferase [Parasphingorhabdus flavimaris]
MKRLIDIIGASATLLILSPVIFLIAMLNRAYLGRPVFFVQKRPGLGGKPFDLLKFRTMKNSLDSKGQPLPDSERLTRYGKLLRSTSLDELPGLWNVVKGEMSLVGPRPLLMEYLPLYTSEQARRHDVRPGITGWAQVNGRNALRWEEKFAADLWYVDNKSFLLDSKIIVMTIIKVLKKDGVNADGEATMSKFTGS